MPRKTKAPFGITLLAASGASPAGEAPYTLARQLKEQIRADYKALSLSTWVRRTTREGRTRTAKPRSTLAQMTARGTARKLTASSRLDGNSTPSRSNRSSSTTLQVIWKRASITGIARPDIAWLGNGIKDNIQVYKIPKFDGHHARSHPPILTAHIKEIEAFSSKSHTEVVEKLLRLFAILLELPDEDQLVRGHQYDVEGEDHLRYMHYAARGAEENKRAAEIHTPGHTDLGSVTLLFRQPIAALQILNNEGQWKWVKPQDGTITINTCDALTALTGGLIKSSIHRVRTPPADQAGIDRLGVLYFARPNNHVVLDPIPNIPVLQRLGLTSNVFTELGKHLTMKGWVKVRQTQQQRLRQEAQI
ncbi:hypothetical protein BDW71DRAFT_202533 [Aspergillus fruticulosus]